jgi:hypothetical protein
LLVIAILNVEAMNIIISAVIVVIKFYLLWYCLPMGLLDVIYSCIIICSIIDVVAVFVFMALMLSDIADSCISVYLSIIPIEVLLSK